MTHRPKCQRCGKCCYVLDPNGGWVVCPYLARSVGDRYYCRIYHKRLGAVLPFGFKCVKRRDLHFNIPNCPFNKKSYKPHPRYY
jgi:hypothetical protein